MESNRKAAFDAVYSTYHDSVLHMAMITTRNLHTAEDITQEVFLKYYLYTSAKEVRHPRNWLLTLSKNLSLNYLRDHRYESVMDLEANEEMFPDAKADPECRFFEKLWKSTSLAYAEKILAALYDKNEDWYKAVTCVYGMARKRQEVADAMGISVDALDGLLKRAKNWIERNYRKEYDHINYK